MSLGSYVFYVIRVQEDDETNKRSYESGLVDRCNQMLNVRFGSGR